jgi:nucleoside-diphosphate-sugar epimerase
MRILILGGTGLLGSGLVNRLQHHGHDVVATARGKRSHRLSDDVLVEIVDRHDLDAMRRLIGAVKPDAVVDGVAYTGQDGRDDLALLTGHTGHLIMISSDFVYKPGYQDLPIPETSPLRAGTPYSEGKADCEEVLLAQRDLPVTVLRPPHILGPNGPLGSGSLQGRDRTLIDRMKQGVPVILLDAGAWLLSCLHVDDAGDAVHAVAGNDRCFGKPYNIASPPAISHQRYFRAIAEEIGTELRTLSLRGDIWLAHNPSGICHVRHRMHDLSRLEADAGWKPGVHAEDAVHRTARSLIEQGDVEPYVQTPEEAALIDALVSGDVAAGELVRAWQATR